MEGQVPIDDQVAAVGTYDGSRGSHNQISSGSAHETVMEEANQVRNTSMHSEVPPQLIAEDDDGDGSVSVSLTAIHSPVLVKYI